VPRYGYSSSSSSSEVEEVVLEPISLGDPFFQAALVDGSEARVALAILHKLVADVGGQGQTEVVALSGGSGTWHFGRREIASGITMSTPRL